MGGKRRIGLYYLSAERTIWTHLIRSLNALAGFLGVELPASDGGKAMKSASDMMYGAVSWWYAKVDLKSLKVIP